MCRAGVSGVERHPLPGGVCGVCTVHGEKEVKPVGLTVFREETNKVSDFKILPFFGSFTGSSTRYLKANEAGGMRQRIDFFPLWYLYVSPFFFLYLLLSISFFFAHLLCFKCRSVSVAKTRLSGWKQRQENAALSRQVQGSYDRLQLETEGCLLASSLLSLWAGRQKSWC